MKDNIFPATPQIIDRAAGLLRDGGLVAFPTETVYGLGADATNDRAVAAIYAAKGRPQFNPLIVHVHEIAALGDLIVWSYRAEKLAKRIWPGPLTMVLPRAAACPVSLLASAGLDTLAVRIPAHPVALELLRAAGCPVAAPSANASGRLSPTMAAHVAESLNGKVGMIIDGGASQVGLESTVLDLASPVPTILRPGGISRGMIEEIIGEACDVAAADNTSPKSPGMLSSHYAPHLPLRMNATRARSDEAFLCFGDDAGAGGGAVRLNLSPSGDTVEAAANLFAMLRAMDVPDYSGIAVMPIPDVGIGIAINDRLRRASS